MSSDQHALHISAEQLLVNVSDASETTAELQVGSEAAVALEVSGGPGPPGPPGVGVEAVTVSGFNTAAVTAGRFVRAVSDFAVAHTDAASWPAANAIGMAGTNPGSILITGIATYVQFTAASPTPTHNAMVFLARADSEVDAAGKVTTDPPTNGFVAPVGLVVAVGNDYATTRVATVLVRVLWPNRRGA